MMGPYLKNERSFETLVFRELASTMVLIFVACFFRGVPFVLMVGMTLVIAFSGELFFRFLKFPKSALGDISFYQQALLLVLFLPENIPGPFFGASLAILFVAYRILGGVAGYVIQPVCLVLALLQGARFSPQFCLEGVASWVEGALFIVWMIIRFPGSRAQAERAAFVLGLALLIYFQQGMPLLSALIFGLVAGELIFDRALMPLSITGRVFYHSIVLGFFALISAKVHLMEALLVTGLSAGFISAWVEEYCLQRKVYGSTKIS